jgi:hypothetical protein
MAAAVTLKGCKAKALVCAVALQGLFCAPGVTLNPAAAKLALPTPLTLSQAHLGALSQQLSALFSAHPTDTAPTSLSAAPVNPDTASFTHTKLFIDNCHNHAVNLLTLTPLTFEGVGALSPLHAIGLILLIRINPPSIMPLDNATLRHRNFATLSALSSNIEVHVIRSVDFSAGRWVIGLTSGGLLAGQPQELLAGQIVTLADDAATKSLVQIADIWFATDLSKETLQIHCDEWFTMMPFSAIKPQIKNLAYVVDAGEPLGF